MSVSFSLSFAASASLEKACAILLQLRGGQEPAGLAAADPGGIVAKAADIAGFNAKSMATLDILAPQGSDADRLLVIGLGKPAKLSRHDWLRAGGVAAANAGKAQRITVYLDAPGAEADAEAAAGFALGMLLRAYRFDAYKTKAKTDDEKGPKQIDVTIVTAAHQQAAQAFAAARAVADGVILARDLVNLPPNALGPVEFSERAEALRQLGIEVDILGETQMRALGMNALLGVAQGSARPPRLAVMQWNGGRQEDAPIAFIGKGVVFDTGGISLKPGAGMEEMKGDMGGAAAVTGLMHVLAARKAKVNAVGIIGLVENMPDGNAQRPGDIVTSLSGQTIEIINTDAEGRLVLADVLCYANDRFKPKLMIDLATLTGAVTVALGNLRAGLFANDDTLAARLCEAGEATAEKLWRLPLGDDYDKIIDSKFADMKNSSGRLAGAVTAAQFLKRFVGETPWAHLDIAGTAMASPATEINQSWGSGFGVRLLDELVRAHHEA